MAGVEIWKRHKSRTKIKQNEKNSFKKRNEIAYYISNCLLKDNKILIIGKCNIYIKSSKSLSLSGICTYLSFILCNVTLVRSSSISWSLLNISLKQFFLIIYISFKGILMMLEWFPLWNCDVWMPKSLQHTHIRGLCFITAFLFN